MLQHQMPDQERALSSADQLDNWLLDLLPTSLKDIAVRWQTGHAVLATDASREY